MRDVIEMVREVKMPYDFVTGEPINIEKLKAFADLVRSDEREQIIATQPAPVQPETDLCGSGAGCLYKVAMIEHLESEVERLKAAVPDALTASDGESVEYMVGWNDCRSLVLEMRKPAPVHKPWVGLTDEEIWKTISRIGTSDSDVNPYAKLADARAIEQRLKEKNTAVPDALTIADKESPEYRSGWNDCRSLMLEMARKP